LAALRALACGAEATWSTNFGRDPRATRGEWLFEFLY